MLALGIGANSTVFTLVNTLLLKPRVGSPKGNLVSLFSRDTIKPDSYRAFSFVHFEELRQREDVFASLSGPVVVAPDGRSLAYTWFRALSNLYVSEGLA